MGKELEQILVYEDEITCIQQVAENGIKCKFNC